MRHLPEFSNTFSRSIDIRIPDPKREVLQEFLVDYKSAFSEKTQGIKRDSINQSIPLTG